MKQQLQDVGLDENVTIYEQKEGIKVDVKDKLYFKDGTSELTEISVMVFDRLVKLMGTGQWNLLLKGTLQSMKKIKKRRRPYELSAFRATAVARSLIDKGVPANKITIVSYGDTRPVKVPGKSLKENKKLSRRVEFTVRKIDLETKAIKLTLNNKISLCLINVSLSEFLESKNQVNLKQKSGESKRRLEKTGTVEVPLNLFNNLLINPNFCGEKPNIIFEDEHLIVLHKPVGIHNHPLSYLENDNCLSYLRETDPKNRALFTDVERYDRGLLYRLDYLTSGLLIFSKRDGEVDLYRQKQGNKFYLAICEGKIKDNFSLENFIAYQLP